MQDESEILDKILENECITPVYQPIVSLTDGQIYGYEALSRISSKELEMDIEQMFRTADKMNKSWELETLCRTRTLSHYVHIMNGTKLFLNVNPNIIHSKDFETGFTKRHLDEYGLDFNDIIFEITERVAVLDSNTFLNSIAYYKNQQYGIAIDDVGSGYSGLNTIANIRPNLMKDENAVVLPR